MSAVRQPRYLPAFRCLAAECEDNCCGGWTVPVDRATYDRHAASGNAELQKRVAGLISLSLPGAPSDAYATIQMTQEGCPFLDGGLCGLQGEFGEEYLPKVCVTYPRTMNLVDDVLEISLATSCPEAARVVLLDPRPITYLDEEFKEPPRLASRSFVDTSRVTGGKPYEMFHATRAKVIAILQDRNRRIWERMAALAKLCDRLNGAVETGNRSDFAAALNEDSVVSASPAQPLTFQLELILTVIVERLSEYAAPAFRSCYQEFMQGLGWSATDTFDDLAGRFAAAHERYYKPFLDSHEYLLENLLVNYSHRTMFPFGPQRSERVLDTVQAQGSIVDKFRLLTVYVAIVQTVLIGVAGHRREEFGSEHVVKVVYAFSRSFEHSTTFAQKTMEILSANGLSDCASTAALLRVGRT